MTDVISMPMDDHEFNRTVAAQRASSGLSAEMLAVVDCVDRGYGVSRPFDKQSKYDLIVDRGNGDLVRLQVKSAAKRSLQARIGWTVYRDSITGLQSRFVKKYTSNDFDYLVIVDRPTQQVYYVPVSDLDLTKDSFTVKLADKQRYQEF